MTASLRSPTEAAPASTYRPDIDGLRAIAVLPVVLYHAGLGFPGGYFGVDIFFVISGYLIIRLIYDPMREGRFSMAEFSERRIRRLFPAMFLMLLATTLWSCSQLIAPDLQRFGGSLAAASTYSSNVFFYFTRTGYFVDSALTKPLLHTWSLGVEEQFYIVAPLALWALVRSTPRRAHVPAIVIVSLLSFAFSAWKGRDSPAAFYLLPGRAWELGLGGVLALAAPPIWRHRLLTEALSICGLGAIGVAVLASREGVPTSVWHGALPAVGAAAILASGAHAQGMVHRLLALSPFTFLGKISYSLYLWHWPVIVAVGYGAATAMTRWTALSCVALSIALAAASWHWVEQPIRTRRWLAGRRALFAAAAAAAILGIAVGAWLTARKGLPDRHPELAALLDAKHLEAPRPDCFLANPEKALADALCVRGAPDAAPSFVLVGDSHAHALSHGLFEAARAHGFAGTEFTAPGFVPLRDRHARQNVRLERLVPIFEDYLRRHPELGTVFITAFWSLEASGRSYRERLNLYVDSDYNGSGAAYKPVAFRRGLERLIAAFPERRFILLDDIPTGDALSPAVHARQIRAGRSAPAAGLPRAVADAQRRTYEPILQDLDARFPNVLYVPALSGLCGPRICPSIDAEGNVLYRDGDHLSGYVSRPVTSALNRLFAAMPPGQATGKAQEEVGPRVR